MNLQQVEFAVEKFYEMCALHPEICPHDYRWVGTTKHKDTNISTKCFRCSLCGSELKQEVHE